MKKMIVLSFMVALILTACGNEATRTGNVDDTTKVEPPKLKVQDSISITDTSYHIGDSSN